MWRVCPECKSEMTLWSGTDGEGSKCQNPKCQLVIMHLHPQERSDEDSQLRD